MTAGSQRMIRHGHRSPHVGHRAIVITQALLGLLELASNDVDELIEADLYIGIEGV